MTTTTPEELWNSLTGPERIALFVLTDARTRRDTVAYREGAAINSVMTLNRGLETLDYTALFPDAQRYLIRVAGEIPIGRFDLLYRKLISELQTKS